MNYESSRETRDELRGAGQAFGAALARAMTEQMPRLETDEAIERARLLILKRVDEWADMLRARGVAERDVQSGRLACTTEYRDRIAAHLASPQARTAGKEPSGPHSRTAGRD